MNKTEIIDRHTHAVNQRNAHKNKHGRSFGGFDSEDAENYDKLMQREISNLGQIHNHRISKKSKRALGIN